ncbi:hypothetical protein [Marinobacterium jannaschii]|uniref:hypothetical protein n=1 Tax=Marinobacterium jannaschii TaxID=64970 RepID=UPI00047F05F8|nr:hypothetical protein [Marinobacterium jannaschii]
MAGSTPRIAFALGGLGGFNAHGVGFLDASLSEKIAPDLISCTSGQIYWAWRYLLQLNNEPDPESGKSVNIAAELTAEIEKTNRFPAPFQWLDGPVMAMTGDPGIFAPAVNQYWSNLLKFRFPEDLENYFRNPRDETLRRLMPAQVFVPERSPHSLTNLGLRLAREQKTGIIFNAFDARAGEEILFVNQPALDQLEAARPGKYRNGSRHNDSRIRLLDANDEQGCFAAVEAALWLYLYGFENPDGSERTLVDGAYHRQFIIRELAPLADLVFSVRPQSTEWLAGMPRNQLQVSNFVTQLWFNSSYSGETARIHLINDLINRGYLQAGKPFRPIRLEPVQYDTPIHYSEYFVERASVYQDAYDATVERIQQLKQQHIL